MNKLLDVLVRVTALLFLACFPLGAMAQVAGQGPICDTADQLEKVVAYATESRNFEASLLCVPKIRFGVDAASGRRKLAA